MGTVVFVPGTGVRQPAYAHTLALVTRAVATVRPASSVRGIYWGERLGARLAAGGASIPEGGGWRAPGAGSGDDVGAWAILFADPTTELRSLSAGAATPVPGVRPPGQESPAEFLSAQLTEGLGSPAVMAAAESAGLTETLTTAFASVLSHPDTTAALDAPSEVMAWLLPRALVAEAVRQAHPDPDADPLPMDGAARDRLVQALAVCLDPATQSRGLPAPVTAAMARTAQLAWRLLGSRAIERRRAAILNSAHPVPGDILVYLARGAALRDLIAETVRAAEPPVTLLGHSLGGIACVDVLVENPFLVSELITVGSQAPLLYELGALPSLRHPDPLPEQFPPWVNVFDSRDLLAFVGAGVFPGRVNDVSVDSRQPFPQAHSAYWCLPALLTVLDASLPADPVPS